MNDGVELLKRAGIEILMVNPDQQKNGEDAGEMEVSAKVSDKKINL
jgi:hypothetical protein